MLTMQRDCISMHSIDSVIYFRRLAVRCLTASRDCFELRAKEEFRRLAEEFTAKTDELERMQYRSRLKAQYGGD
jgi:hypothetical protein